MIDWKEGHVELARSALESLGREQPVRAADLIASGYAEVGDADHAFAWLGRAAKARLRNLNQLRHARDWAPYRDDPRFIAVLRELHLLD